MTHTKIKYAQPDESTPFGLHLKEVTKYLNIGLPSFTGTFNATLLEEERWKIQAHVPGRTFAAITKPIDSVLKLLMINFSNASHGDVSCHTLS